MLSRLSSNTGVIGLDIGRSSIKAAQVSRGAKGSRLDGMLCIRRTGHGVALTADEAGALRRAMLRAGLDSKRIALVATSDAIISGSIDVPPKDSKTPRDPIVKMELSRAHRLSPDAFEYAWWDLPGAATGASSSQAHAVALPHAVVQPTLEALDALGLEVMRTLPASCALLAAAQRRPVDPRRIVAVIDLGSTSARLTLMHAGKIVHERRLPEFDSESVAKQLGQTLGTTPDVTQFALGHYGLRDEPVGIVAAESTALLADRLTELNEQIAMSFAFVSHLYPHAELGPLLLSGGAANVPGLTNALSQDLELESAVLTPGNLLPAEHLGEFINNPVMIAALGAALNLGGAA